MQQTCDICKNNPSKYKCPTCFTPFCSAQCSRVHKENCVPIEKPRAEEASNNQEQHGDGDLNFTTENTIPPEILSSLDDSEKLKDLLRSRNLQKLLKNLDRAGGQARSMDQLFVEAMKDPEFQQFVEICFSQIEVNGLEINCER